jgi:hypothetical protein
MKKILLLTMLLIPFLSNAQEFKFSPYVDQVVSCYGNNDGYIQANCKPEGEYVFTISNKSLKDTNTSGSFFNLKPGTYTVCATNGVLKKCEKLTVTSPKKLNVSFTDEKLPTLSDNKGAISLTITGGTTEIQPYLVNWFNSKGVRLNTDDTPYSLYMEDLPPDLYTIKIEDDHGCFLTKTHRLTKPKK